MRFFSTAIALAAIPTTVFGAVFTVTVGAGGTLAYNPSNITAAVGDQVNFEFQAKNHSVTQSSFTQPCQQATFNGALGANSGFLPIPPNSTFTNGTNPTWSITINNTTPLWFHCAQTIPVSHCQKGMVFSINATPQKTFATYLATAMASANATMSSSNATLSSSNATLSSGSNATSASGVNGTSAPSTASQAASNQSPNGASKLVSSRGAAGLLTVVTIGAMFL